MFCDQNDEMGSLRKKLEALEAALGSPGDTAAGLARRLIRESPAPSLFANTPKLSVPSGQTREIDLDTSTDLFATPACWEPPKKRPRPADERKPADNVFRTSSAVGKPTGFPPLWTAGKRPVGKRAVSAALKVVGRNAAGKTLVDYATSERSISVKSSVRNVGSVLSNKMQFGVSVNFSSESSVFRVGYNGFGGHEKVVVPPAKTKEPVAFKKLVLGGQTKQFFGPSKTARTPPLPSLDDSFDD